MWDVEVQPQCLIKTVAGVCLLEWVRVSTAEISWRAAVERSVDACYAYGASRQQLTARTFDCHRLTLQDVHSSYGNNNKDYCTRH